MKDRTTRCFSDVWQLRLEMPGGGMTEEDRQIDVRTETMGPWRRCYTCGDPQVMTSCYVACYVVPLGLNGEL